MKRYRVTMEVEGSKVRRFSLTKSNLRTELSELAEYWAMEGSDVKVSHVKIEDITPPKKK